MSLSLKNTMLATTALCLTLALSACGAEETSVAETVPVTTETAVEASTTSEGGLVVELPDDIRPSLAEAIASLPAEMQERFASSFPDEITDDFQDMMEERILNMGDQDLSQLEGEGKEGRSKGGQDGNVAGGHHHDHEPSEAFLNNPRIELDGSKTYADGTYTGTADAYQPGLTVEITIKDNQLTDIIITDHNETPGFFEEAFEAIPAAILGGQSTDVDMITGATASSEGIIVAVEQALAQAEVE